MFKLLSKLKELGIVQIFFHKVNKLYNSPTCLDERHFWGIKSKRLVVGMVWLECLLVGRLPRDFASLLLPWEGLRQRQQRLEKGTLTTEGVGSLEIRLDELHRADDDRCSLGVCIGCL